MTSATKNRSPKYPSKSLDWAVNSALSILNKQGGHPLPPDVVATSLGYKNSESGPSRQALATLKTYGILEKVGSKLRLSQSVQSYKLAPTQEGKDVILRQWLMTPSLFSELFEIYGTPLPSDEVLIHYLVIERGFSENAAKLVANNLRSSIDFANLNNIESEIDEEEIVDRPITQEQPSSRHAISNQPHTSISTGVRYPVRLAGGRMAYIEVPENFYSKDKKKLEAQLTVIGTIDEDEEHDEDHDSDIW